MDKRNSFYRPHDPPPATRPRRRVNNPVSWIVGGAFVVALIAALVVYDKHDAGPASGTHQLNPASQSQPVK